MTFQDLLRKVKYKPVFNIIHKEYYLESGYPNDQMMHIDFSYSKVFDNLLCKDKIKSDSDFEINFEMVEGEDDDPYINIYLHKLDDGERFGLDFVPWGEALSFNVNNSLGMSEVEMTAHILWEMTFWGFTEETVNEQREITLKAIEESEAGNVIEMDLEDLINELR
tara:strand:- start:643 stop:1140 length:498 start_codon:yes stop_codon:yes gene_type:complete